MPLVHSSPPHQIIATKMCQLKDFLRFCWKILIQSVQSKESFLGQSVWHGEDPVEWKGNSGFENQNVRKGS